MTKIMKPQSWSCSLSVRALTSTPRKTLDKTHAGFASSPEWGMELLQCQHVAVHDFDSALAEWLIVCASVSVHLTQWTPGLSDI